MKKIIINKDLGKIIISILFFILSFLFLGITHNIFLLLSYIVISYELYIDSWQSIRKKEIFDENLLMILATIGAILIKKYEEAVIVILLFQIGEYLSHKAVHHSKEKITSLMDLRCEMIDLKTNKGIQKVGIQNVKIGDLFIVKPGEKVGLDGIVIEGNSSVDTSSLTGENIPQRVAKNSKVMSGVINKDSLLTIKATTTYETSTATKIIHMIENSTELKTNTERFITKFSRVYTPIVVILAILLTAIPVLLGGNLETYLYRSLVFLVTSCPCALVISIPLGYFCGIGRLSHEGILAKGSREIDQLNKIEIIAFDKTGTITEGVFEVTNIWSDSITTEELLSIAAHAEYYSLHPIAKSIVAYYGKKIDEKKITHFQEFSGKGVEVQLNQNNIVMGNSKLMQEKGISFDSVNSIGNVVYVAQDKKYIGYLIISDQIKQSALSLVKDLKEIGIKKVVMLSGDKLENVQKVSQKIGINHYFAELLPLQKVEKIKLLKKEGIVAFVGDGINDAPVLKMSDVGISMGSVGSDAAIEASDVVLMHDNLEKIRTSILIAKMTRKIVKFNILFAILAKVLILLLGIVGVTTVWLAVFADVGVTILTILNTLRIMVKKVK